MNFLAHAYLSGDDPEVLVGNFLGDFVKGKNALSNYPPGVLKGILLHRLIDAFTDAHPVVLESKKRLRPKFRHFSAVIVDVFYDHFLAANWRDYHRQALTEFAAHVYSTLEQHRAILPGELTHMLHYMSRGNWLVGYGKVEGINRALTGMAQRSTFDSKMELATLELKAHYEQFHEEFRRFFPLLKETCENFIRRGNDQSLA